MFKRSQQDISDGSKSWYQDKYQHVLTQRNLLALISIIALASSVIAGFAVLRLSPLKSVEPYLLQVDEKTGVTQRVNALSRSEYIASESVDRYFTYQYLRMRESYNVSILRYNDNVVRLMSTPAVFRGYRYMINPENEEGFAKRLGAAGQRDVRVRSMAYIVTPGEGGKALLGSTRNMQARITTTERLPNSTETEKNWVVTVTFEYADLNLNTDEQYINPLGYNVIAYQIQPETL